MVYSTGIRKIFDFQNKEMSLISILLVLFWIAIVGSKIVAGDVNESGCQTLPFNYTISVPGCQPKSIKK